MRAQNAAELRIEREVAPRVNHTRRESITGGVSKDVTASQIQDASHIEAKPGSSKTKGDNAVSDRECKCPVEAEPAAFGSGVSYKRAVGHRRGVDIHEIDSSPFFTRRVIGYRAVLEMREADPCNAHTAATYRIKRRFGPGGDFEGWDSGEVNAKR